MLCFTLSFTFSTSVSHNHHMYIKPGGRGFDSRWCHWNFSGRTMVLGLTQSLTEMSTRNISWGVKEAGA